MATPNNGLTPKQQQQLLNICTKMRGSMFPPVSANDDIPFLVLMRICRDYADTAIYPFVKGEARDKMLIERLQRFSIKYFQRV